MRQGSVGSWRNSRLRTNLLKARLVIRCGSSQSAAECPISDHRLHIVARHAKTRLGSDICERGSGSSSIIPRDIKLTALAVARGLAGGACEKGRCQPDKVRWAAGHIDEKADPPRGRPDINMPGWPRRRRQVWTSPLRASAPDPLPVHRPRPRPSIRRVPAVRAA